MQRLLYHLNIFFSLLASFFSHEKQLFASRFARSHEVHHLLSPNLENLGTSLLLGVSSFNHIACVRPTKQRQELGNLLICASPRSGKTLLAISQLLTWRHSVIVNDIKGELYQQTADYRATLGPVYVIDPVAGVGSRYDPFAGRTTERQLSTLAHHLLFDPTDRDPIFIQRAIKMLTQMCRAARLENKNARKERFRIFPYVSRLVNAGPKYTAEYLQALSPELATKFLSGEIEDANFTDDRFLLSCWGSIDARLWPLLTDEVIRCFDGQDFTAGELMTGKRPATVYLRIHESELAALAPLVRLLFGSLINGLIATYDRTQGEGCRPVLVLADEAGRTAIPMLADAASTVLGRRIYLWIAVQSLAHLELVYGRARAQVLRDTVETQLYFRPTDTQTARYLEERLGHVSGFARSETLHNGEAASEGLSERPIPLLASQDIALLSDEEVIAFHRNNRPLKLKRMDWREHTLLVARRRMPPPTLSQLPEISEELQDTGGHEPSPHSSWRLEREGFDHRIGHLRPLKIIGGAPNSPVLHGLGASTRDRSRWGGRRHDQGQRELLHGKNQTSPTNGFRKQEKAL
jgi:type IV secretion system protein VirD4